MAPIFLSHFVRSRYERPQTLFRGSGISCSFWLIGLVWIGSEVGDSDSGVRERGDRLAPFFQTISPTVEARGRVLAGLVDVAGWRSPISHALEVVVENGFVGEVDVPALDGLDDPVALFFFFPCR